MSRKIFVSAKEVADRAGVSRSAVSRTFTPGASVSEETRRRVTEAAEELGYHVNHLARGLMRNESGIVCLIVSEMDTPYRARLVRALTQQLQVTSKIAMLINTDRSDESVDQALRQAISYRADASIILSGMPDKSITDLCLKSGQRLVLINRDEDREGALMINLNDRQAARRAFIALLRAGCRSFAFANSEAMTPSLMAREEGFCAAGREHGFEVTVERFGPTTYQSGAVLAQRLLTREKRPDAIFCVNDLLACGLMDAARHQFNLVIPSDVCVIGFDDIEQSSWSSYNLTTFAQPIDRIATEAVAWLDRLPAELGNSQKMHAELVWRGSVRGG
ncbi:MULTISPECIES: substrate-binding domain-containing protein [unclassified Neorhizobium]|uniref:LacI family DNA-binding transcriptional regulator n=1 Tax=unclassified Neorhizobium TaxID=2629175 RepID=UPI001FF39939|nr:MULTISPECIES: substrate-binding domain-containing protein [unclassified Neorhizobium]MCJ9669073.1 substrate-binding domain-containing protein [Neorhizobium sp. SHOUNA12B]MCJ9743110.1 substrate-binding domain-containing protein [Neorhizobium sp. SHOUNA12A]